jgi:hypothetical protein
MSAGRAGFGTRIGADEAKTAGDGEMELMEECEEEGSRTGEDA